MTFIMHIRIRRTKYIDTENVLIGEDELNDTMIYLERIKGETMNFAEGYVAHVKEIRKLYIGEFERRYVFSL